MDSGILTRSEIEEIIPHAGGMCLLEGVLHYSETEITCMTSSHLLDDNPLKKGKTLSNMHLIEYGAQSIAIHGGLLERNLSSPRIGYIATIKSVKWGRFNPLTPFLKVESKALVTDDISKLYTFHITDSDKQFICSGRVMVVHPF
ncbi:MAG: hypothetical protein U9R28_01435 [Pseudomonadota bacterium]|nr:hypothetical protein [Pseudomonadota bacterium]